MNNFYTPTGVPQTSSQGTSAVMRNEFDLIADGFDKLPLLTGNANRAVVIDPTGAFMTVTTGTLALAGNLTVSNNLTFIGTNGSSVDFGGGGTVLYTSGSYVSSIAGTAGEITASASTGAVTLSLPAALTFTGKTVTGGTFNSTFNGTLGATTPASAAVTTLTASGLVTVTAAANPKITLDVSGTERAYLQYTTSTTTLDLNSDGSLTLSPNNTTTLTLATDLRATFAGAVTMINALTYGGVTLSNSVTGTGSMVLSGSPTLTGAVTVTSSAATNVNSLFLGGTTTGHNTIQFQNSVGRAYFGVESSAGSSIFSGATAYATVFGSYSNTPVEIYSNALLAGKFTSTGFQGAIGATTPSTGAFTTLTASGSITGSTLVSNNNIVGGDRVYPSTSARMFIASSSSTDLQFYSNAGSILAQVNATGINSTNIGATTPGTGAFTTLSASSTSSHVGAASFGTASTTQGSLVLHNTSANSVTLKSSNSTSAAYTITLPVDDGTSGQVLSTDGAGVTSWVTASSGITVGTTTITSGTSGRIAYNNAGVYGEKAVTGTGDVVLAASPTITGQLTCSTDRINAAGGIRTGGGTGTATAGVALSLGTFLQGTTNHRVHVSNLSTGGCGYCEIVGDNGGGVSRIIWQGVGGSSNGPTFSISAGALYVTFGTGTTFWWGYTAQPGGA